MMNTTLKQLIEKIEELKTDIKKHGGASSLFAYLQDHEIHKEIIFIKNKKENSFSAYLSSIRIENIDKLPLSKQANEEDYKALIAGMESFVKQLESSDIADQENNYVYLVATYPDVKTREHKLAIFKKFGLALHKYKNTGVFYYFDSTQNKFVVEDTVSYEHENLTTVINIKHATNRSSQIRLYNPSGSLEKYLGGFGMIMYTTRYHESVAMKGYFKKVSSKKDLEQAFNANDGFKVENTVVPALIESIIHVKGDRSTEFADITEMPNYLLCKKIERISGLYVGYYISQDYKTLDALVAIILANGKTLLMVEKNEAPYSGFFNFIDDSNVRGRFHYTGENTSRNYFRFQFNFKEDNNQDFLMGTYSGRGAVSYEPMAGRIIFHRKDIESLPKEISTYIKNPTELEEDEAQVVNHFKNNDYICSYLLSPESKNRKSTFKSIEELRKQSEKTFTKIINFFLGNSDSFLEGVDFMNKYMRPLLVEENPLFTSISGFYYLYSYYTENKISYIIANAVKIDEYGKCWLKRLGGNQLYEGQAKIYNQDRMDISFTRLNQQEICPLHFIFTLGINHTNAEFYPGLSLSAVFSSNARSSRDFLVKIIEQNTTWESLSSYRFQLDEEREQDNLRNAVGKDHHQQVVNFIYGKYNNLLKATKDVIGDVKQRSENPIFIYLAAAYWCVLLGQDKQLVYRYIGLAIEHGLGRLGSAEDEESIKLIENETFKQGLGNYYFVLESHLSQYEKDKE